MQSQPAAEQAAVDEAAAEMAPCRMAFVGQKDVFGESGKPDELRQKYGMTADDIVNAVRRGIGK